MLSREDKSSGPAVPPADVPHAGGYRHRVVLRDVVVNPAGALDD